jgi:hypothetical protein
MRPLLALLTITLFALPAQAQPRETKGSVSAVGGMGTTYDDESSLGGDPDASKQHGSILISCPPDLLSS